MCKDSGIKICTRIIHRKDKKTGKIKDIKLKSSKVNQHMCRHTFATRCIEAGMSAVVLQRILGHANINQTLRNLYICF